MKICGMTRAGDAAFAAECGADAIGFIAYPKSPRFIDASSVKKIAGVIHAKTLKVAVFVNPGMEEVKKYLDAGADVIQLHGDESAEFAGKIAELGEVWKAIRPGSQGDVLKYKGYPAAKFLIDTPGRGYGGTGRVADWLSAKFAVENLNAPVILAGGLTPANIADAVKSVKPFGVDVSSGVESSPGIKDHGKMKALFSELRKGSK